MTATSLYERRPVVPASRPTDEFADEPAHSLSALRTGLVDMAPFALAVIPFGLAVGTAAEAAGLTLPQLMFGAVAMLAGAGQLAAVQSMDQGDGLIVIALVVGLVNLRFVLYGAGVASWFGALPLRKRLLFAFPVVDQTFLLCQQRFADEDDLGWRQRYFATGTVLLGGTFVLSQAVAHRLGAVVPAEIGLHLAGPLTFTAMFARSATDSSKLRAGALTGALLILASPLLGPAALPGAVMAGTALVLTRKDQS